MQLGVPQTQGSGGGGAGPGHGQGDKNRSRPRQHGGTQRPTPEGGQQPRAGIPAPRMQGVNAAGGAAGVPRDASLAPSSAEEGPAKKPRRKRAGGRGDGQGKAGGSVGGEEPMSGVAPHAQVPARAVHRVTAGAGAAGAVDPPLPPKAVVDQTFMTSTTFRSLGLHPATQQALDAVLRYEYLTKVQEASMPACLSGVDVLARAKTGTGKTLGFLIPSIERLARTPGGVQSGAVHVLVLSPTRELALQIAKEAAALLTHHSGLGVQCVYGGTNMRSEQTRLGSSRCDVLVATPGRLVDHIQNTPGLVQRLSHVRVFVMDEADQLLDMGFKDAVDTICGALPAGRQTLLFSATVPPSVRGIAQKALRRDHVFVDTVGDDSPHTAAQVKQCYVVAPFEGQIPMLVHLVRAAAVTDGHKVLCFFPTARQAQFHAELLNAMGTPVLEIHSRMSQAQRERASAAFRAARNAIMMSSDVSARGVDYPDVSAVIQVGAPSDRSQYIHRVGRTARAGKAGDGMLLLAPHEAQHTLAELRDLPLVQLEAPPPAQHLLTDVARGLAHVDSKSSAQCYGAWLGLHNGMLRKLGWSKEELVQWANAYGRTLGLASPPALPAKTVGKMGLRGVAGLVVEKGPSGSGGGGGGGRGGGRGAGGGRGQRPGAF